MGMQKSTRKFTLFLCPNNTFFQSYRIKDKSRFIRTEKARQSSLSWSIIRRALSALPE